MENVNVLHPGESVNDPKVKSPRSSSKFDLTYGIATGQRFGQLMSHYFYDAVPKDKTPFRSSQTLRSYTLKSPLMSDLSLKKDYFQVPRRALLPLNFEKVFDNPPLGDDVVVDVGTTVESFSTKIHDIFVNACGYANKTSAPKDWVNSCFYQLIAMGYFYSYGSLLAHTGFSMEQLFQLSGYKSFDAYFDAICKAMKADIGTSYLYATFKGGVGQCFVNVPENIISDKVISFRRMIEMLHDDISSVTLGNNITWSTNTLNLFSLVFDNNGTVKSGVLLSDDAPYDIGFCHAYQMTCAHYYTNDSIDYVYSADLYRQVVDASFNGLKYMMGSTPEYFEYFLYNGITCKYDACSAHNLWYYYNECINSPVTPTDDSELVIWFTPLSVAFAWRNSLRFTDYFTGAKSRPLAVGDVNIAVNSGFPNYVSVLDVTKNIQRQRFFNAVNRTGRKIEQYLEKIFGTKPSHDWHNPLWLGHTKDTVIASEVENSTVVPATATSADSQVVTASLRSNSSRYVFEVDIHEPSILVGISYFDIPRFYVHATEKVVMHKDRFDYFNPFMQFTGDQPIAVRELSDKPNGNVIPVATRFGYTMNYMEYKQRFSRALGPFATGELPSWLFTDSYGGRGDSIQIDPNFIRSSCVELDPYFISLTEDSLANYFHFIMVYYNLSEPTRNMVYAPDIL